MRKYYLTHNVCLKCGKEWEERLPFEERPHSKLFGICEKCKEKEGVE
jgi:hypothetical protein